MAVEMPLAGELLTLRYDMFSDGYRIINGAGKSYGLTMLSPSEIIMQTPGKTTTEAILWLMETGQYTPRTT
jgi:hypothetical protein